MKNFLNLSLQKKILLMMSILILVAIFYRSGETAEDLEIEKNQSVSVSVSVAEKIQRANELWFTGTVEGFTSAIISSKY